MASDNYELVKGLQPDDIKVLYLYATVGNTEVQAYRKAFFEHFNISSIRYNQTLEKLAKKRLIVRDSWNYLYRINPIYRAHVLKMLFTEGSAMAPFFRRLISKSEEALGFFDVFRYAVTGNAAHKPNRKVALSHSDMSMLTTMPITDPVAQRILQYSTDDQYVGFIKEMLENCLITDVELSRKDICNITSQATTRPESVQTELSDIRDLTLYLKYGDYTEPDPKKLPNRLYALLLHAVRAVNMGEYAKANTIFTAAFKHINPMAYFKNVIPYAICSYYYIMCLVRLDTPDSKKKLTQYLNKKDIDRNFEQLPSLILAQAFTSREKKPPKHLIDRLDKYMHGGRQVNVLINFQDLIQSYFSDSGVPSVKIMPELAIMRHEMRDYLPLSPKDIEQLNALYGDKPALTSIKRKKAWEWALDDMLEEVEKQISATDTGVAKAAERIIYGVDKGDSRLVPFVQTWLKAGRWSTPKKAPLRKFEDKSLACMNETDRKIADEIERVYYSTFGRFPTISEAAHLLVGCDRLHVWDGFSLREPVTIDEGTPYVEIKRKADRLSISSNITASMLDSLDGRQHATIKNGPTSYTVLKLNPSTISILGNLLRLKELPLEAEEKLKQFLGRLIDVIEVRSPLIDSKAIPTVDGSTTVLAQVSPSTSANFAINFRVRPIGEGGSVLTLPGTGRPVVYDMKDEKSLKVKRDLEGENDNYHTMLDAMAVYEDSIADTDYSAVLPIEGILTLMEYSRQNPQVCAIEWIEGKPLRLKETLGASTSWSVGLKANNGWFDIEGEVRLDENTVITMAQMLELVGNSKGRYVRLNENDYITIDKKLRKQLERIEALAVKNHNKMQISNINATLLDSTALDSVIKVDHDEKLDKLRQRIKESNEVVAKVPRKLNATLRPYQVDGYQWMTRLASWGAGACLADDMGLGKTVQTIAFMLAKGKEGPSLVVAPASVVPNWAREMEKFAPSMRVVVLNKEADRGKAIADAGKNDVILTTYGLLNTESEHMTAKEWCAITLDEAHTIKNKETKMSQAAMKLQGKYRIILTGTPIQNHLGELWNLFRFINPGLLGSFDSFRHKFVTPITQDGDKERRKALQRMIKPFMLRRTKADVIDDLPEKTEIVMPVELADDELAMYESMRMKAVDALESAEKLDVNTLSEITKLRRAACSMQLVHNQWRGSDSKLQTFMELVKDFKGDNNKMLVFSQFTSFLDLARKALDKAGEKYLYLDGSTSMKKRDELVEEFREGDCPLFLISLKAGGLGLNLPEANYVVHLDPWWNPAIEQQATDRAYRIGQERNVTVYHLVAQNTIEEKIKRLHRTKRDLADSLLEGTDMAGKLTLKDILELVSDK